MPQERLHIDLPDSTALMSSASAQLAIVREFVISDDDTYSIAGEELKSVRAKIASLDKQRLDITRPMDEAKKRVMSLFKPPIELLTQAADALNIAMVRYYSDRQKKLEDERKAAEDAARAVREKIAEEARLKQQEAIRLANEARAAEGAVVARLTADSLRAIEEARSLELQSQLVSPSPVSAAPKSGGATITTTWKAEVVSFEKLVQYVAEHPEYLHVLKPDESALNALAVAMKSNLILAGVRAVEIHSTRVTNR
jgi:hypothetical protein